MAGEGKLTVEQILRTVANAQRTAEEDHDSNKNSNFLAKTILQIYYASQQGILNVADKLAKGFLLIDDEILPAANKLPLPEDGEHDFVLGDWVEIKYNCADFKSVQKRTLGWNSRLNTIYGHRGVVTRVASKYDNSIQLHFPEIMAGCTIYAPVLRKIDVADLENLPSRWKPGDMVKVVPDPILVQILQRGYDEIPKKYLGSRGRVTAVTKKSVIVSFDEQQSYLVHPSGVLPCSDTLPIEVQDIEHPRGFKVGQTAKMIKNMKRLIENQDGKERWHPDMFCLRGEEVTIIDVQANSTVGVQPKNSPAWRVNADSVLKLEEEEPESCEELEFVPGEIVKFQNPNGLRRILTSLNIPQSFLGFMQSTTEVLTVDEELDVYVLFHADRNIAVNTTAIRKATASEVEKHTTVKNAVKELKVGDRVHLDVGPPNYVRDVLSAASVDASIKMAMTKSATLVGLTNPDHAVIEYDSRMRYKINKKYLTSPEKFKMTITYEGIKWKTVQEIQEVVSNYVREIHEKQESANENWTVEILAMSNRASPSVDIKVQSLIADPQGAYNWLCGNSGWDVELICEGHLLVKGVTGYKGEIRVAIFFNDEELDIEAASSEVKEGFKKQNFAQVEHRPTRENHCKPQLGQHCVVEDMKDFRYIRLSDPSLAQDVHIPYIVLGNARSPTRQERVPQQSQGNFYQISNSTICQLDQF